MGAGRHGVPIYPSLALQVRIASTENGLILIATTRTCLKLGEKEFSRNTPLPSFAFSEIEVPSTMMGALAK